MAGTKQWRAADGRLQPGFQTAGFTLKQVGKLQALGAQTLYFEHEKSGASLFYIRNKDTNRGFSISYRTPHLDETDTNHVFEHSVLASSDKYPSKDIFFDLCSKTYHTFVNAFTYIPFTAYPVCSQSEEQLLKMADVYLSCMKAPGIRRERRFFDREAVRYELRDRESPITLAGTVYSEDFGMLNDTDNEALRNVLRALYPGETAANANGQAHRFYKDLTYEHTMEMYDRFYRFDNALILLYGDLDWKRFLAFLDKEYLCDAKKSYGKEDGWSFQSGSGRQEKQEMQNIGMSAFYSPEPDGLENGGESFFRQATVPSPAYRGDASENAAVVSYAMDLSGISWEKLIQYSIIAGMMNVDGSVFREKLRTAGIHCDASASVMMEAEKPFFVFEMTDCSPKDAERFRQVSDETLCEMQERGIDPSVVETALKARAIHDYTAGEDTDVFADSIVPEVSLKWALTGDADVYADEAAAYDSLDAGTAQTEIRRFAAELGAAKRRVLVTTVPTPGMAEAMERERDTYLAQMKAGMSEAELDALIAKTLDFDAWNASECSNADFMIRVDELPSPEETPEYQIYEINGVSVYESRLKAGEALAKVYPAEADMVAGVPDSGITAAQGYAKASGIPFGMAFYKNSYVGRTFIKPTQEERESSVRLKLSVLEQAVKGKNLVLVDDSIVRGTTIANLIRLLKQAGAGKVHVRISSPPFLYPCYYGTDVPSNKQLLAVSHSTEEIRRMIGADSLGYMKVEDLAAMAEGLPLCKACFDNRYPTEI